MFTHRKQVKHFNIPRHAHFLTFSCYHGLPLLSKDRTRKWFLESLQNARTKHAFDLWAWVIMLEHVHLLIFPRETKYSIDKILRSIKQPVAKKAIRFLKDNASGYLENLTTHNTSKESHHFWQIGPGYDKNVEKTEVVYEVVKYIHANPVRRDLVDKPIEWKWSSARDWAGLDDSPIQVDRSIN